MLRAHKIRLLPTPEQEQNLFRAYAAARFAWNWVKEKWDTEYDESLKLYKETGQNGNGFTHARLLKKEFNQEKPDWVKDRTATATQEAFDDAQRALGRYFDIRKGKIKINLRRREDGTIKPRKDGRAHGWLRWRSKHKHNSFRVTYNALRVAGRQVRYNRDVGFIKMSKPLRFEGDIKNGTFSFDGRFHWVSIQVDVEPPLEPQGRGAVGVDLGLLYLAVTSDGEFYANLKAYKAIERKLARLQRKLDRQRRANNPNCYNEDGTPIKGKRPTKTSGHMNRTQAAINRLHIRARNLRNNAHHQLTAYIAKNYGIVCLENLNINGMLKNRNLAKAISDAGWGEIGRQLAYKTEWQGAILQVVDRFFPSSKMCSGCGELKLDMSLDIRAWECEHCGQVNERDMNAAINLRNEGLRMLYESDIDPAEIEALLVHHEPHYQQRAA